MEENKYMVMEAYNELVEEIQDKSGKLKEEYSRLEKEKLKARMMYEAKVMQGRGQISGLVNRMNQLKDEQECIQSKLSDLSNDLHYIGAMKNKWIKE